MRNRYLTLRRLVLAFVFVTGIGFASAAFSADLTPLRSGGKILVFPLSSGTISVYGESSLENEVEKVPGENLLITLTASEGKALYGSYSSGGKKRKGWFSRSDLLVNPDYTQTDAILRYQVDYYTKKEGKLLNKIKAYTSLDILGQSGNWYLILYKHNSKYRIGWIKKSDYDKSVRIYKKAERRIMAEGTYTIRPKGDLSRYAAVSSDGSGLQTANPTGGKEQVFTFRFVGDNCYRIYSSTAKRYLVAESTEDGYTGNVVLEKAEEEAALRELWQLTRNGACYTLKNMGTDTYLKAGSAFSLTSAAGSMSTFRIAMSGGKNTKHWQVFCQYDPEWAAKLYGKYNTMAGSACGILSIVNSIYALNGQYIEPMMLAEYSVKAGYRVEHAGTDSRLFKAVGAKYGKTYGFSYGGSTTSLNTLKKHLQSGGTAIAYVPGHYMAVGAYKNGKYFALDSYATAKRATSPFGIWVAGSRFLSGSLKARCFFLWNAIP